MAKYTTIKRTSTIDEDGFLERVNVEVNIKLKRCPICGGKAEVEHVYGDDGADLIRMHCEDCGTMSGLYSGYEEAACAWNKRRPVFSIKNKVISDCPFCAGKMEFEHSDDEEIPDGYFVQCTKCGARSKVYKDSQTAAKAFNRRV